MLAPPRVERRARRTTIVHRAREPIRDERAREQDADEHGDAQKRVSQLLYRSRRF